MDAFVDREEELLFLDQQYTDESAALVVLYGRRRVGKTSLVHQFAQDKPFIYFLASEEAERQNMQMLKGLIAGYTGDALLAQVDVDNWDIHFQTLAKHVSSRRLVLMLDEFQYLGKANPAFPSIFQRVWDVCLRHTNIRVTLIKRRAPSR